MNRLPKPLTPDSLNRLMDDERYWQREHPEHETYRRFVRDGFETLYPVRSATTPQGG